MKVLKPLIPYKENHHIKHGTDTIAITYVSDSSRMSKYSVARYANKSAYFTGAGIDTERVQRA